jgi:SET domain-containing protein
MKQRWVIKDSKIQGIGVFSTMSIRKNEMIDVGIIYYLGGLFPNVTFFGSKINHSYNPNVILRYSSETNTWNVYAKEYIPENAEILLDYNDTPNFIKGPSKEWGIVPRNYTLRQKSY